MNDIEFQMKPCYWGGEIHFSLLESDSLIEVDSWTDEALPLGWKNPIFLVESDIKLFQFVPISPNYHKNSELSHELSPMKECTFI